MPRYCYWYYTRLLGARKFLFPLLEGNFEHDHGRAPTPEEMQVLKREAHESSIGPRGYMIGKKAAGKPRSPTFFTDEQIVVTAFILAIGFGVSVVILAKDEDIQEQFYKLQYMIDGQYRSMLFSDAYEARPSAFATFPLEKRDERIRQCFIGDDDILVQMPGDNLESVLPESFRSVPIYCWTTGSKMSQMIFTAETGMRRLFYVKAKTDGLNTGRLGLGRNCHISLEPLPIEPLGAWASIAQDNMIRHCDCRIPLLEINQSIVGRERFRRVERDFGQRGRS